MNGATLDPCLAYRKDEDAASGVIAIQIDDTIFAQLQHLRKKRKKNPGSFLQKEMYKSNRKPNSVELSFIDSRENILIYQAEYMKELEIFENLNKVNFELFKSIHAKYACAAFSTVR